MLYKDETRVPGEREDQYAQVPIVHLIAARLIDRSDLLDTLAKIDGQDSGTIRAGCR